MLTRLRRLACGVVIGLSVSLPAQTNGVDLTLTAAGQVWGVPCSAFSGIGHFPFLAGGTRLSLTVHAAPRSLHLVLVGPPPTTPIKVPGIEGELRVHTPIALLVQAVIGPLDPASGCGQGVATTVWTLPVGPSSGYDFALQAVGTSSVTGGLAFSDPLWVTYL